MPFRKKKSTSSSDDEYIPPTCKIRIGGYQEQRAIVKSIDFEQKSLTTQQDDCRTEELDENLFIDDNEKENDFPHLNNVDEVSYKEE